MKLWIAKPEPGASRLAKALKESGVSEKDFLVAPVMEINAPKVMPHFCGALLETLDAILVTSPHALRYVAQYSVLKHLPAYVVGKRAQTALKALGHDGEIHSFKEVEDCLAVLKKAKNKPKHLLYVSGEHIARDVEEPLEAMGVTCERVITYRQTAAQELSSELIEAIRDHAIMHVTLTSPRIALLCSTLAQRFGGQVGEIVALCQSEAIAKVAEGVGFEVQHIADTPTADAMVELIKKR